MSFGTYVKGIDGLMAGATSGWLYDVNDQSAEVGADSYKLKSGDVVVFRFVSDWNNMSQETLQQTLDKFGTCKTAEEPKQMIQNKKTRRTKTDDPKQEKPEEPKRMIQKKRNQKSQRRMIQNRKIQMEQKHQNNQSKRTFKFQQHK